jgi:hypothetical protein
MRDCGEQVPDDRKRKASNLGDRRVNAVELGTSRYQASELIVASGLIPVGITVGRPRWLPTYAGERPVYMKEAAPYGLLGMEDRAAFTERYLARLNTIGIDLFLRRFVEISDAHDGRGLVFLCFEADGEFCHRHLFARWLEQQTGQRVRELRSDTLTLFE